MDVEKQLHTRTHTHTMELQLSLYVVEAMRDEADENSEKHNDNSQTSWANSFHFQLCVCVCACDFSSLFFFLCQLRLTMVYSVLQWTGDWHTHIHVWATDCIKYGRSILNLHIHWFQKEVGLYVSLWENDS